MNRNRISVNGIPIYIDFFFFWGVCDSDRIVICVVI